MTKKHMSKEEIIIELEKMLAGWDVERKEQGLDTDSWLQTLYASYRESMHSSNERIWSTGALLLPLSVSAFALVVSLNQLDLWKIILLAIGSLVLIWAWLFIAENHRAFQQKSEAWLVAIQRRIGIDDKTPNKAIGNRLDRALTFHGAIQKMRWGIAGLVSMAWVVLFLWVFLYNPSLDRQARSLNDGQPIRSGSDSTSSAAVQTGESESSAL